MNKHFEDSLYYLRRTGEHAKLGVEESLEPVVTKGRALIGREPEPEPESRVEALLAEIKDAERKAEGDTRKAIGAARERLEAYRSSA